MATFDVCFIVVLLCAEKRGTTMMVKHSFIALRMATIRLVSLKSMLVFVRGNDDSFSHAVRLIMVVVFDAACSICR